MHFPCKDQSVKIAPGSADAFDDCFIRNASPWISRQTNKIIILNSNQDIVEQVYAHICKNYDSPLKINELANQFGISRSRLFTRFKERYGKTPKQFILIVKIDKAKQMIQSVKLRRKSVLAITSLSKKPSKKQPDYRRPNGANAITEVCF